MTHLSPESAVAHAPIGSFVRQTVLGDVKRFEFRVLVDQGRWEQDRRRGDPGVGEDADR